MKLRTMVHPRIHTFNSQAQQNGYLIPIYNVHEGFFTPGKEPQQVYLTVVAPRAIKGPHLHYIRTGFFTCIKGNVRIVVRVEGEYQEYYSGESYNYLSVEVPVGIPAVIQNVGDEEAFVLNMPNPAWTPEMKDEHSADFSDFDFGIVHLVREL